MNPDLAKKVNLARQYGYSDDMIRQHLASTNQLPTVVQPKKKNAWITMLPSALAAAASFIPGVGTAAAAGLGGIGELGRQALSGEKISFGGIAKEAALSAIPGALGQAGKLIKGGSLLAKGAETANVAEKGLSAGEKLASASEKVATGATTARTANQSFNTLIGKRVEKMGGNLMNSQTNLTRAEMRRLGSNAPEAFNHMAQNYNLSNLDDIAAVSHNVTGMNGVHSEAVRNAIGNGKGIDTGDLRDTFNTLLDTKAPLISDGQRKGLASQFRHSIEKMYSQNPLNPLANPLDAHAVAQDFRGNARLLRGGANVTAENKQLAQVYDGLAGHIEKKLYAQPGVSEVIPAIKENMVKTYKSLADEVGANTIQGKAYLKLADEANGMSTIADLRTAQKPWVTMSKIDEKTAEAAGNAAAKVGGMVGGRGGVIRRGVGAVADQFSVPIGKAMSKAGAKLKAGETAITSPVTVSGGVKKGLKYGKSFIGQEMSRAAANSVTGGGQNDQTPLDPLTGEPLSPDGSSASAVDPLTGQPMDASAMGAGGGMGADPTGGDQPQTGITREGLMAAISADPKNADKYLSLYTTFAKEDALKNKQKNLTGEQTKAVTKASNASNVLDELYGAYQKAGGGRGRVAGKVANFEGRVGLNNNVDAYNQMQAGALSQIARAFGEAGNMSDQDIARVKQLMPKIDDNDAVAQAKIGTLRRLIASARANAINAGGTTSDPSQFDPSMLAGVQ